MRQAGSDFAGKKAAGCLDLGGGGLGPLEQEDEDQDVGGGAKGGHEVDGLRWWDCSVVL